MGSNKATFEVDGIAMAQRVALAATESGASEVLLIGGSQAAAKGISGTWVKDAWPGEGPLGGIITALKNSSNDATIVLSCDMPFLTPAVIHSLLLGLSDAQAAVGRTDRLNWLCSAWSQKQCLTTMLSVWKRNERAVHRAAAILDVIEVPVPANAVRNINSLADLDVSDGSTI